MGSKRYTRPCLVRHQLKGVNHNQRDVLFCEIHIKNVRILVNNVFDVGLSTSVSASNLVREGGNRSISDISSGIRAK